MSNSFLNQTSFTANTHLRQRDSDSGQKGVFPDLPKKNVGESKLTDQEPTPFEQEEAATG